MISTFDTSMTFCNYETGMPTGINNHLIINNAFHLVQQLTNISSALIECNAVELNEVVCRWGYASWILSSSLLSPFAAGWVSSVTLLFHWNISFQVFRLFNSCVEVTSWQGCKASPWPLRIPGELTSLSLKWVLIQPYVCLAPWISLTFLQAGYFWESLLYFIQHIWAFRHFVRETFADYLRCSISRKRRQFHISYSFQINLLVTQAYIKLCIIKLSLVSYLLSSKKI